MSRIQFLLKQMKDYEIDQVKRYLKGEHVHSKRGRYEREHVTSCLIHAIEDECGIQAKGIEIGAIHINRYKRNKKRKEKYWAEVRAGKRTDTRRGFDKERKGNEP